MIHFSFAAVKIFPLSLALSIFIIRCLFVGLFMFIWSLLAFWMCGLKFFMRFTVYSHYSDFFFFCSFCLSGNLIMGVMGHLMVSRVV